MSERTILSVIIVNWNVRDLLLNCLSSLFAYNCLQKYEVIVVDNNSIDESAEYIRCKFPQVKLIENIENVGFARANNQGIAGACGRYILLLNPDTYWIDDSLQRMLVFMDAHPEIGAVGPKLLNADRQSIQYWGARMLPFPKDTFFEYTKLSSLFPHNRVFNRYLMGDWDHASSREVECLSGSCMLIRRETLQEVGLLDENYPLYAEDTDWCHRVSLTKWKLFYYSDAQLVHIGQQSSLQNRGPATIKAVKGIYRYYSKFYGVVALLSIWFFILIASVAKIFAWSLLFPIVKDRTTAINQVKSYMKICTLVPFQEKKYHKQFDC